MTNGHGGNRPGAGRKPTDTGTRYREAHADKERALADIRLMEAATKAGELIPADEVAETVATAFQRIAQTIFALPDQLERRAGLTPEQAETAQRVIHDAMDGLADDLAELTPPEPDDAA